MAQPMTFMKWTDQSSYKPKKNRPEAGSSFEQVKR